ncbi:RrF2 family transcriptional regulator [Treponema endosymbiont of Eucomonympha sp.]|uniref:RrF2 family transcriptional regulator n=1 Tax=Treponema endosymbiont of Eucomonympha sp. TaxID=1580831 RepID=UPI000750D9CB|nr:Rrf2 family transcriptional regulator [Treponema endosymbiont of Eucomonympha sp.]
MRISTRGRYSLEALLYMALLPEGVFVSTRGIADGTGISERYLEQLLIPLRRAGIVQGARGPNGGFVISDSPANITAGRILRTVEGSLMPVPCVKDGACEKEADCGSRNTWSEMFVAINTCIDAITLADLVAAYHALDNEDYVI